MSIQFDANGDGARRTTDLPDYNAAYTWMLWNYFDSSTGFNTVFSINQSSSWGTQDQVATQSGTTQLILEVDANTTVTGTTVGTGAWFHLAFVRSSSSAVTVYLNGVSDMVSTASVSGRSAAVRMDVGQFNGADSSRQRTAAIKVWTAALTVEEVVKEMRTYRALRRTNLYLETPLMAGATERLADYSGFGRNWTAVGTLTDVAPPPLQWAGSSPYILKPTAGVTTSNLDINSDARLKAADKTLDSNSDATLKALAKTADTTSDATLKALAKTLDTNSDARLKALGLLVNSNSDANLKALGQLLDATSDALLLRGGNVDVTSDARLKALDRTADTASDARLKALEKTLDTNSDARLKALAKTLDATSDARLLKAFTVDSTSDADLVEFEASVLDSNSDARLKALGLTFDRTSDALLLRRGTLDATSDAQLTALLAVDIPSDARLKALGKTVDRTSDARKSMAGMLADRLSDALLKKAVTLDRTSDAALEALPGAGTTKDITSDGQLECRLPPYYTLAFIMKV